MKLAYSGVLLASVFFSPNGVLGVGREFEDEVLMELELILKIARKLGLEWN